MRNALRILDALDQLLEGQVELTLYGRAALFLSKLMRDSSSPGLGFHVRI